MYRHGLFISLLLLASASICVAEESEKALDVWMPKGRVDWGFQASYGRSHGSSLPERTQGILAVTYDRVLTGPVGPGFLRGRMGVTVELIPVFLLSQTSSTAYGAGFNLLGRHYLDTHGSVRPFITLGAGMILSEDAIPEGSAKLNFTPQAGLGIQWRSPAGRMVTVEYRFHHLSNASRVQPNPGINSSVVLVGFSFARRLPE